MKTDLNTILTGACVTHIGRSVGSHLCITFSNGIKGLVEACKWRIDVAGQEVENDVVIDGSENVERHLLGKKIRGVRIVALMEIELSFCDETTFLLSGLNDYDYGHELISLFRGPEEAQEVCEVTAPIGSLFWEDAHTPKDYDRRNPLAPAAE